jgi:hypothetical protein
VSWPGLVAPVTEVEPNTTLDQAQGLGTLTPATPLGVVGTIANSPDGAGGVDFYQFSLNTTVQVHINTLDRQGGSPLSSVVTLYDTDPTDPMGYHLIGQDDGATHGGDASLTQTLGPGTYYVAVSGSGNRYFYPFLVDSGLPGSTGNYGLSIQAGPPGPPPSPPPPVTPNAIADDTITTANNLGDVSNGNLVQVAGNLGNDPKDPASSHNLSDVDLYHFSITTPGNYAFAAEVFGGRIDSPLQSALTLFEQMPDGSLQWVAANGGSLNTIVATNGAVPLYNDAALVTPLAQGNYYLAVSSGFNYVDPPLGQFAGQGGIFDPLQTHSGTTGSSQGPYVLNLRAERSDTTPHVVSVSVPEGAVLSAPPTAIDVRFDAPMNLEALAFEAYAQNFTTAIPQVYIAASDGSIISPRLTAYDPATNQATFSLLDALPNGDYTFHLVCGSQGLTDLAGRSLAPNDFYSGDYITHFTVNGPLRGSLDGGPTAWNTSESNDSLTAPQVIGPLFPDEIAQVVTITRPLGLSPSASTDTTDYYQVTLLQSQIYVFSIATSVGLPDGTAPTVWFAGQQVTTTYFGPGAVSANLGPGTYLLGVDWTGSGAADVSYQVQVSMLGAPEVAPSLTTGPAPVLAIRLVSDVPPSASGTASGTASTTSAPAVLPGAALAPVLPAGVGQSAIFLALWDAGPSSPGGNQFAGNAGPGEVLRVQVRQPFDVAFLPGALVSIHTLGLDDGGEAGPLSNAGGATGESAGARLAAANLVKALWSTGSFLPDIDVNAVVQDLTDVIDAIHISWDHKPSGDSGTGTKSPSEPDVAAPGEGTPGLAEDPPVETLAATTTPVLGPASGEPPPPPAPSGEQAGVEKSPGGWRFSPWTVAAAGLSACALLLMPLQVFRVRRHRKNLMPPT